MKLRLAAAFSALMVSAIALPAFASPDLYVVNFHQSDDQRSQKLTPVLKTGLSMAQINAEEVLVDTSNLAKWEKAAHAAIDRQIVPVYNRWVGLPGFAAIVDAKQKNVIGCVSADLSANEIASELRKMAAKARGEAIITRASARISRTACPDAFNKIP